MIIKEVEHINGCLLYTSSLERKTSGGVTGFDITSYDRLIAIADNYEITSTGTTTQEQTVEGIFVNLDSDQNANTGKTFNANLIMQEEEITTNYLSDYIINEVYAGVEGSSGIYYHCLLYTSFFTVLYISLATTQVFMNTCVV